MTLANMLRRLVRLPLPQPCHRCPRVFAGPVCPGCYAERPLFTMLKRMTVREGLQPQCRYFPHRPCECQGRGVCIPVA
ncbi:MAG TPA: hypothetical protein VFV90_07030 [Usitatibacter sp.]|nr:hypothetical protein [Usitatibacter sp.]